jgi:hypothetical protein
MNGLQEPKHVNFPNLPSYCCWHHQVERIDPDRYRLYKKEKTEKDGAA